MKKKFLAIAFCSTLLSVASISHSAEGPYVSGSLGLAIASDSELTDSTAPGVTGDLESDKGLALGIAAGYDFGNARLEGELAYQKNDMDKLSVTGPGGSVSGSVDGDTSSTALLLNGYYDFKNTSALTPFIGAGLGFAKIETDGDLGSDDDTVFAYQVGFGAGYAVNEKVTLDLKYRYFATSDPEFDTTTAEYSSHNIYAGIRVGF